MGSEGVSHWMAWGHLNQCKYRLSWLLHSKNQVVTTIRRNTGMGLDISISPIMCIHTSPGMASTSP